MSKAAAAKGKASGRRSVKVAPRRSFPWAWLVGGLVVLGLFGGVLTYAGTHQGSGVAAARRNPDSIAGLSVDPNVAKADRNHVEGKVSYAEVPPDTGRHNAVPQTCAVYAEPIAPEHALHSLEHGAVWITYSSALPADQVRQPAAAVSGNPYQMLSPVPGQSSPVLLSAWGRRLPLQRADDERVQQFLQGFTNGRHTPEPGAACAGTDATGPLAQ